MGTKQSNEGAQNFFNNLGNAITNTFAAPGQLSQGITSLLSNPLSGLMLPIMGLGALYIISQKM